MIGIDTNVLLRFFESNDNKAQTTAARELIRDQSPVFLNPVVLVEFAWVLRTTFEFDRPAIHSHLAHLVSAPEFTCPFPRATQRAVDQYGQGAADFADCLMGELNLEFGCEATMTFDKKASKPIAFTALKI